MDRLGGRDRLGGQETTSGRPVITRLIRHSSILQAIAVVPLAVPMVFTAFRAALVLAIRLTVTRRSGLPTAVVAAVALTSEAATAHAEACIAPAAHMSEECDTDGVHDLLKGGWTVDAGCATL